MIINFSVQNFGSIKDKQTLSFEADKSTHLEDYYVIPAAGGLRLLKLALIYGANASGKTTVLKALNFLRNLVLNPEDKKTNELKFKPFLFDPLTPHQNTIFSIEFIQNEIRYAYEVELNNKAIVSEELNFFNPNKANVFKRTTDLENQQTKIKFGSKIKKNKIAEQVLETNTLWNNTVLGGFLKTNMDNKELKDATDWFDAYLKPIIETKTDLENVVTSSIDNHYIEKNYVLNILKKADFNISGISIEKKESDKSEDYWETLQKTLNISDAIFEAFKKSESTKIAFEHTVKDKSYVLPSESESQGTMRYYSFTSILYLLMNDSLAVPIDELESSLHPDLYVHFLLSFLVNSKKSQLIATTHNREILNNKDIFRNDAIWFTDKSENCATELYSLADFDSSVIRDTTNVYNAYKIGKLGAVPNLGDYYIDIQHETK